MQTIKQPGLDEKWTALGERVTKLRAINVTRPFVPTHSVHYWSMAVDETIRQLIDLRSEIFDRVIIVETADKIVDSNDVPF